MNFLSSPTFFIILMILGGGASAYLADMLGFKIGKKRLSIFRIRPKHVARITVTVAGAMIPLATIFLMSSSSSDFREWLIRGREAIVQLQQTVKERDRVQSELVVNQSRVADLSNRARKITLLYEEKEAEVAREDKKIKSQTQHIREQQAKVDRLNAQLKRIESENKLSRQQLATQKALLATEQSKLKALREERAVLEKQKQQTAEELENARIEGQDIKKRNLDLDQDNQKLLKSLEKIQTQVTELGGELVTLRNQRDMAQTQSVEARAQLKELQTNIDALKGDRDRYEEAIANLKKAIDTYRETPQTFVAQEEVTRMTIPAGLSLEEAKVVANSLLRQARIAAEKRGAKYSAVPMVEDNVRLFVRNPQGRLSPPIQVEQLWPLIANQNRATLIAASAAFNFYQGEPVWLIFTQHPNPVVFQDGEVITESRIDGRRPEGVVYGQVTEFLVSKVNDSAKRAKMVPVRQGYEDTFGALGPEDLLSIVRQIHEANRIVRIQAVSSVETRAGDRLKINLRIK